MTGYGTGPTPTGNDLDWLRTGYEQAPAGERPRRAALLALALLAHADTVDDADRALPRLLDELLEVLAVARPDDGVTAAFGAQLPLAAGLARWRRATLAGVDAVDADALDAVVADLTAALGRPWSEPPARGRLAGPRFCLAAALVRRAELTGRAGDRDNASVHHFEGQIAAQLSWPANGGAKRAADRAYEQAAALWRRAGTPPRLGTGELAAAAPRARRLLAELPADHPTRPMLRHASVLDVVAEASAARQWPASADQVLADLRCPRAGDGAEVSAAEQRVARAAALVLGAMRLRSVAAAVLDPATMDFSEVDRLRTELDALTADEAAAGGQGTPDIAGHLTAARVVVGMVLAVRVAAAHAAGKQPDPADEADSKRYLAGLPNAGVFGTDGALWALLSSLSVGADEVDPAVLRDFEGVAATVPEFRDAMGGRIVTARALALRAARSQDAGDVAAAVESLRDTARLLPSTHPALPSLLALTANLLAVHATLTSSPADAAAAYDAALAAAELTPLLGPEQTGEVLDAVAMNVIAAVGHDLRVGSTERAQRALERGLAGAEGIGAAQRFRWMTALGAALALQWDTGGEDVRARARAVLTEAERLLVELPSDVTLLPNGIGLFMVLAMLGVVRRDRPSTAAATRVLDHLERRADTTPSITGDLGALLPPGLAAGLPPGLLAQLPPGIDLGRGMLTMLRTLFGQLGAAAPLPLPPPAAETETRLAAAVRASQQAETPAERAAAADRLTALLADGVTAGDQRGSAHAALARCLAALVGLDPDRAAAPSIMDTETAARLAETVRHLKLATVQPTDRRPTVDRALLLQLLAAGLRARAAHDDAAAELRAGALDAVRAALRELLAAVLLADGDDDALRTAAIANRITLHAVHQSIVDGDLDTAVSLAEAGRALMLTATALGGRLEDFLRDRLGRADLADGWARHDLDARLGALGELTASYAGFSLTAAAPPGDILATAVGAGLDAVVYVVPPVSGSAGALIVLGRADKPALVRLDGMEADTPARYQEAFGAALADAAGNGGMRFRELPAGPAWAAALDEIGAWCHRWVVGPLLRHAARWELGREPRVALIPLGDLGAVPFATAWSEDTPGERRYAVRDVVLSQAASGRVLFDAARRRRQPVDRDVVLITDPDHQLLYGPVAAEAIAGFYPAAREVEGATVAQILDALPAADRPGASLLHITTHGRAADRPMESELLASDRWLRLGEVLDQARARPADAPGGLVICDACVTDSAHSHLDESLTLANALLTAGACAVIGTRWPIDDDTASVFALHLHAGLAAGHAPAYALRQAQLAMLDPAEPAPPGATALLAGPRRPGLWAEPASWAGYVVHGAWAATADAG